MNYRIKILTVFISFLVSNALCGMEKRNSGNRDQHLFVAAAAAAGAAAVMHGNTPAISPEQKAKNHELIEAARSGDYIATRDALRAGANVNVRGEDGLTALMIAASLENVRME